MGEWGADVSRRWKKILWRSSHRPLREIDVQKECQRWGRKSWTRRGRNTHVSEKKWLWVETFSSVLALWHHLLLATKWHNDFREINIVRWARHSMSLKVTVTPLEKDILLCKDMSHDCHYSLSKLIFIYLISIDLHIVRFLSRGQEEWERST